MKNNKLRNLIEFVGLDYKKEIIKLVLSLFVPILIGIACFLYFKIPVLILLGASLGIGLCYLSINSYLTSKEKILTNRDEEFIDLINNFQSFIENNNNVYSSFEKCIKYSSPYMREKIENFLKQIDIDKSVKPFIDFGNEFRLSLARNIMLTIYQMIDEGEDNLHLNQFETLFSDLLRGHQDSLKAKKEKQLSSCLTFPMIGTALLTIILTIGIVNIMGELLDVI